MAMIWKQQQLAISPKSRGFHLITQDVVDAIAGQLREIEFGTLHVFIQHTSASLTINENADSDVRLDMETAFNSICPEESHFVHTCEGPDDMPAHVKSSLLGSSLLIPITNGRLNLGIWQGIYLCEHRNQGSSRRLVLTISGSPFNA